MKPLLRRSEGLCCVIDRILAMWFPSFRAWRSALRLSILAYLGIMVFPFYAWFSVLLSVICLITTEFQSNTLWLTFLGTAIILLIVGFVFYIAIKALFRLVLWILWSEPPKWLLPAKSIKVNLHKYAVLSAATLPLVVIFTLIITVETHVEITTGVEIIKHKDFLVNLLMRFFWLWLLSSAYLLHWFPLRTKPLSDESYSRGWSPAQYGRQASWNPGSCVRQLPSCERRNQSFRLLLFSDIGQI